MRSTLYGHFVAGTDKKELKPMVERLHQHNVKLILDYCMESDIASSNAYVLSQKKCVESTILVFFL